MNKTQKNVISLALVLPPLICIYAITRFNDGYLLVNKDLSLYTDILINILYIYGISIPLGIILFFVWKDKK
ncbi:MAG: hypothetical protein ABH819_03080 [Patescibacteria group bacterium]